MFSWRIFGAPRPSRPQRGRRDADQYQRSARINGGQRSVVQATVAAYPNSAEDVAASVWLGG